MEPNIFSQARDIVSNLVQSKSPQEKIALVLKAMPVESFDDAFRSFSTNDRQEILEAMETPARVGSFESVIIINQFVEKNGLFRFLKTVTRDPLEIMAAFQKYAAEHPRKIGELLEKTWLGSEGS